MQSTVHPSPEICEKKGSKKKIRGGKTSEKAFARTSSPPTRYSWFLPDIRRGAAIVVVVVAPPSLDRFEVDGATLSLSFSIYIYIESENVKSECSAAGNKEPEGMACFAYYVCGAGSKRLDP